MLDVFLDALLDSLKIFGIAFIIYFIFSFVHDKVTSLFQKHKKISPMVGSLCGLIPECGISIVGADMYKKEEISMGTILAIFFTCSDEALFILLGDYHKMIYVLPLLLIKFIFGFIFGYMIDFFYKKQEIKKEEKELKLDCCEHEHHHEKHTWIDEHLLHPLFHCLKIFGYVFFINLVFGILIYYITEDTILSFLGTNKALGPLFAGIVGLIPNCASSVLMSKLFLLDGLSFGALITGLSVNSGLGILYLLRFKETRKNALWMTLILLTYSLMLGYILFGVMECIG